MRTGQVLMTCDKFFSVTLIFQVDIAWLIYFSRFGTTLFVWRIEHRRKLPCNQFKPCWGLSFSSHSPLPKATSYNYAFLSNTPFVLIKHCCFPLLYMEFIDTSILYIVEKHVIDPYVCGFMVSLFRIWN